MKKQFLTLLGLFVGVILVAQPLVAQPLAHSIEKKFQNKTHLVIDGSFCAVKITGTTDSEISLKGEIYSTQEVKIRYSESGSTLKVYLEKPNSLSGSHKGVLTLMVPKPTNLEIQTASGNQTIEQMGEAEFLFQSASGNIQATELQSGVFMQSASGNLYAKKIKGKVKARSASGDQSIQHITGDLESNSASGSVQAEGISGFAQIQSASGNIQLTGAGTGATLKAASGNIAIEEVNGQIQANTASGDIQLKNLSGSMHIHSVSGNQQGEQITLVSSSSFKSVSGGIQMEFTNAKEQLSFNLESVSGSLSAKGSSARKKLETGSGSIEVSGNSVSGSQSYH